MHKIRLKFGEKTTDIIYNLATDLKVADSGFAPHLFVFFSFHQAWRIKHKITHVRFLVSFFFIRYICVTAIEHKLTGHRELWYILYRM